MTPLSGNQDSIYLDATGHFSTASGPTRAAVNPVKRSVASQQPTNVCPCDKYQAMSHIVNTPSWRVGCSDCTQLMMLTVNGWRQMASTTTTTACKCGNDSLTYWQYLTILCKQTATYISTSWVWKHYRCCRKKMKSRWLWNVTTRRPWNCGSWGNNAANIRANVRPSLVLKLLRITSGTCLVISPLRCNHNKKNTK